MDEPANMCGNILWTEEHTNSAWATLTYNPNIGFNFVSKSDIWTNELSGKTAFDFQSFKIIYRGIGILWSIEVLRLKTVFFGCPTAL